MTFDPGGGRGWGRGEGVGEGGGVGGGGFSQVSSAHSDGPPSAKLDLANRLELYSSLFEHTKTHIIVLLLPKIF